MQKPHVSRLLPVLAAAAMLAACGGPLDSTEARMEGQLASSPAAAKSTSANEGAQSRVSAFLMNVLAGGRSEVRDSILEHVQTTPAADNIQTLLQLSERTDFSGAQEVVKRWAAAQLSGERLDWVESLLQTPDLSQVHRRLVALLLSHAEDAERAQALMQRYGLQ